MHGSAKTEQAELLLLEKLLEQRDTVWYFPETDFSTAHYFEAYLRSRVLWDVRYDAAGKYTGYATRGGWGVSDSWRERFRGIGHLKRHRRGEMTFFDLRGPKSPYAEAGCMDLVVCRRLFGRTEQFPEGVSTLDYLDAAVLIRSSRAAQPIEEWMNR